MAQLKKFIRSVQQTAGTKLFHFAFGTGTHKTLDKSPGELVIDVRKPNQKAMRKVCECDAITEGRCWSSKDGSVIHVKAKTKISTALLTLMGKAATAETKGSHLKTFVLPAAEEEKRSATLPDATEADVVTSADDAKEAKQVAPTADVADVADSDSDADWPTGGDAPKTDPVAEARATYEALLAVVEPMVGPPATKFVSLEKAKAWADALASAKASAKSERYDIAKFHLVNLQDSIKSLDLEKRTDQAGSIAAQVAAAAQGRSRRLKKEQLKQLDEIDQRLAARAGTLYKTETLIDGRLLKRTDEKPREVRQVVESFGSKQAEELGGALSKGVDLAALVQQGFATIEKDLTSAKGDKARAEVLRRAGARVAEVLSKMPDAMAVGVLTLTPEERKAQVIRSMGLLKDKYKYVTDEANLSKDKQDLVKAITEGFEQAAVADKVTTHCKATGARFMSERLGALKGRPDCDEMFDLAMKSREDLQADAAVALGLVQPGVVKAQKAAADVKVMEKNGKIEPSVVRETSMAWYDALDPRQRALIDASAEGMSAMLDAASPNRMAADGSKMDFDGAEYEYVRDLGAGGLATAKLYKKKGTGEPIVVKSLHGEGGRLAMEREAKVHRAAMDGEKRTRHENVVSMEGMVRGPNGSLHMVLQEAKGGDLDKMSAGLAQAVSSGAMPDVAAKVLAKEFLRDAVAGMKHVQEMNVTHHDIKPENFLLGEDGTVMVADFGSGQLGRDEKGSVAGAGDESIVTPTTAGYQAPEMLGSNKVVTGKADTYTLGVVLDNLFNAGNQRSTKSGAFKAGGNTSALDRLTKAMRDADPSKRPTLEAVERSSFLREADVHDPDKVAALKKAAMEYAKVVAKAGSQQKMSQQFMLANGLDPKSSDFYETDLPGQEATMSEMAAGLKRTIAQYRETMAGELDEQENLGEIIGKLKEEQKELAEKSAAFKEKPPTTKQERRLAEDVGKNLERVGKTIARQERYAATLAELKVKIPELEGRAKKLVEQVNLFSKLPSTARQKTEAEAELAQVRKELEELSARDKAKVTAANMEKRIRYLNVFENVIQKDLEKLPEYKTAKQNLEDASAPFSGVKEDAKALLPTLKVRLRDVTVPILRIENINPQSQIRVKLAARLKEALDLHDKADGFGCRDKTSALEDAVARVLGSKQVEALLDERAEMQKQSTAQGLKIDLKLVKSINDLNDGIDELVEGLIEA